MNKRKLIRTVCYSGQLNILMSREQWLRTFYDFEESEEEEYDYPAAPIPPPRINTPLNAANLNVSLTQINIVYPCLLYGNKLHSFIYYRKVISKLSPNGHVD